jgi:hypothetical protein
VVECRRPSVHRDLAVLQIALHGPWCPVAPRCDPGSFHCGARSGVSWLAREPGQALERLEQVPTTEIEAESVAQLSLAECTLCARCCGCPWEVVNLSNRPGA